MWLFSFLNCTKHNKKQIKYKNPSELWVKKTWFLWNICPCSSVDWVIDFLFYFINFFIYLLIYVLNSFSLFLLPYLLFILFYLICFIFSSCSVPDRKGFRIKLQKRFLADSHPGPEAVLLDVSGLDLLVVLQSSEDFFFFVLLHESITLASYVANQSRFYGPDWTGPNQIGQYQTISR